MRGRADCAGLFGFVFGLELGLGLICGATVGLGVTLGTWTWTRTRWDGYRRVRDVGDQGQYSSLGFLFGSDFGFGSYLKLGMGSVDEGY